MDPTSMVAHFSLDDWLKLLGLFAGGVMWAVRLEGKSNTNADNAKRIEATLTLLCAKLEERMNHYESTVHNKLSMIERSLAKIEGKLSIREDRQD